MGSVPFVGRGVFLREPYPYLRKFRRKTTENSKLPGRQMRPKNEPGTSSQPVFQRSHWWGLGQTARYPCLTWELGGHCTRILHARGALSVHGGLWSAANLEPGT